MKTPIAVLFYIDNWKTPKKIEIHEFEVTGGGISQEDQERWLRFKAEKQEESGLNVGWCHAKDSDAADAAFAYYLEEKNL